MGCDFTDLLTVLSREYIPSPYVVPMKNLPIFPANPSKSFLDQVLAVLLVLHKSTGKNLGMGKSHVMPEPQTLKVEILGFGLRVWVGFTEPQTLTLVPVILGMNNELPRRVWDRISPPSPPLPPNLLLTSPNHFSCLPTSQPKRTQQVLSWPLFFEQILPAPPNRRVPQIRDTFFGSPYYEDYIILGSILGYPYLGTLPH